MNAQSLTSIHLAGWIKIETIKIHRLVSGRNEVMHELLLGIVTGIHFRDGSQLRVRTEH